MKRKILLILNMAIIGFSTAACSDDETNYITPEKKYPLTTFAVAVNMADALPDLGFVKLNSLFIAVWNTEREVVLQQIGTGNITKMLANLNA